MNETPRSTTSLSAVLLAVATVIVWRMAALMLLPAGTSLLIPAFLALVGLTFLVCGLLVFLKLPSRASLLFVGFCICSGMHWGGPLELAAGGLRTGLILFYLLISGILGATLLLHLALAFPKEWRIARRRAVVACLYLPFALAAGLAVTTREGFLLAHTILPNLFSVLALVFFVIPLFGNRLKATQKKYVGLMVAGMLVAWLPYIVTSATGIEDTDVWNLSVFALPLSFTIAFFGIHGASSGSERPSGASKALILLFVLLIAAQVPAARANPADAEVVLPSEFCRGMFIVPVTFGEGEGTTLDLLLDTGSSWTILDPKALRGLVAAGSRIRKASFKSVRIGPHKIGPLQASVLPMKSISLAVGRELDGILGFPAFRDVLLTLDYPAGELRVSRGSLPRPDGREIFRALGKRPHLEAGIGDRRVKLLLDSGFTGRFEFRRSDFAKWTVVPRPATSHLDVEGVAVLDGGRPEETIRFGPLDFENPVVILGGDRLAGGQVLRHFVLTFDQKKNRMRMRANHTEPVRMPPLVGAGLGYAPRPEGLEVVAVFPGSAAEAAGLRKGDLVVAIDGVPVHPRGCGDSRSGSAGQRRVFSYIRDDIRAEAEIETEALVP